MKDLQPRRLQDSEKYRQAAPARPAYILERKNRMKHLWLPLILCGILLLSSCGTSLSDDPQEESKPAAAETHHITATEGTADEIQLQDDLCNSDVFKETAMEFALELTDFKVIKRQTTPEEKIDKVWVAADAETSSADYYYKVRGHLECILIYGLYNDGWILDEVTTEGDPWSFVPLSGFSDEILAEIILIEGGEFISNVVDLDQGTQYTTFRKTFTNQYCESVYVIEREWVFSAGSWNVTYDNALDANETWHINGRFSPLDHTQERWISFNGTSLQWDDRYIDSQNLKSIGNMTQQQFVLSAMSVRYVEEIEKGYSVKFDNVDWSDIRYAAKVGDATIFRPDILLIGESHIYRWNLYETVNYGTKTIHYEFEEWLPIADPAPASGPTAGEPIYLPGTYTGTGSGWDSITVSVTVDAYSITEIKVIEDNETVGVGSPRPLNQIIESILKKNSTDVDTVSGATITSNGVIAAVKDALTKAQKP